MCVVVFCSVLVVCCVIVRVAVCWCVFGAIFHVMLRDVVWCVQLRWVVCCCMLMCDVVHCCVSLCNMIVC